MKQVKSHIAIMRIVTALSHKRLQSFAARTGPAPASARGRDQPGRLGGDTCADSEVLAEVITRSIRTRCARGNPHVTRSLTAVWRWKEARDSGAWYWTRSSIGMLLAGEQFAAARLAILTAVLTSLLAPDWMARSAVIESLTPPAHDSMSVVRS